jgi:transposase
MSGAKTGNKSHLKSGQGLRVIRPDVAGIDIGSRSMHVAGPVRGNEQQEVRVFATTTEQIQECGHWLKQQGVTSVAMESTGVYWIPVFEILESAGLEVLLVDTRPMSRAPGRKTDVVDCQWIQTLHSCGLLRSCYQPSEQIGELRSIVRQKAVLVAQQSDWLRRMQKCLDLMNVRVHHAVSDVNGVTGQAILRAIVAGERNPVKLAELRDPACRKSKEQIAALLNGHWRSDHLKNLESGLKMVDFTVEMIAGYEREIEERLKQLTPRERMDTPAPPLPNRERMKGFKRRGENERGDALYRMVGVDLTAIDGIGVETAEIMVSEYGTDPGKFETEKQFVAHLQLAPNKAISGGKPIKKRVSRTKGGRAGQALRTAAVTVQRGKTALGAYYRRISRSKGATVAVFATARKLATLVFRLLRWGQSYVDIGQAAYEERHKASQLRSLTATASQLGYQLTKTPDTLSA